MGMLDKVKALFGSTAAKTGDIAEKAGDAAQGAFEKAKDVADEAADRIRGEEESTEERTPGAPTA
jgi:hypothetical protein